MDSEVSKAFGMKPLLLGVVLAVAIQTVRLAVVASQERVQVSSSENYALSGNEQDLELLLGSDAHAGIGNALDNVIVGNEIVNGLVGHGGNDDLTGGSDADSLVGGLGDDVLRGGDGDDKLVGNDGNDQLFGGGGDDLLHGQTPTTFSGILSALTTAVEIEQWMGAPGVSRMESQVRFSPDLPSDVVFGIDQEFLEGGLEPLRFVGADWMAMAGVTRDGILSVRVGTEEEINGTPAVDSIWESFDLGVSLVPDTWYLLQLEVDFGTLEYISFTISGPGVNIVTDLSGLYVSFTEFLPSDVPALMMFVWAARSPMGPVHTEGLPVIRFDDVRAGFDVNNTTHWELDSSFEQQNEIGNQPDSVNGFEISNYAEGQWYLERIGAAAWVEQTAVAFSGTAVANVVALGEFPQPGAADEDELDGGDGKDTLLGGGSNDVLRGGDGDDSLDGGPGDDVLEGGAGDDTLQGRDGADMMSGGPGSDVYVVLETEDSIVENTDEGTDSVIAWITYTLPTNVENLLLDTESGPIDGFGNDSDNFIAGNDTTNTLAGAAGNDFLLGEGGMDELDGGDGDDVLDGGSGADTLAGGDGDDLYFLDDSGDVVQETSGEGIDTVFTVVDYQLDPHVEDLALF